MRAVRAGGRVVLKDDDHGLIRLWPEMECCPNLGVAPPSWRLQCRLEAGVTV